MTGTGAHKSWRGPSKRILRSHGQGPLDRTAERQKEISMFPRRMLYALSVVALVLTAVSVSFLKAQPGRGKPIHVRGFIIAQLAGQQTLAVALPKTRLHLALPNVV